MKRSKLKTILRDHRLWCESRGKQGRLAHLQGANLQGAYLVGADLQGADLQGADLQGADLRGANLYGANLQGADLQGVNLRYAHLEGAKFTTNFKKVRWFRKTTFSEDQIPWIVLHPKYPEWADTLKWVKVVIEAA